MITDDGLYSLAIFLGCFSMLLIVLYHFLEINAVDSEFAVTSATEEKVAGVTKVSGKKGGR